MQGSRNKGIRSLLHLAKKKGRGKQTTFVEMDKSALCLLDAMGV